MCWTCSRPTYTASNVRLFRTPPKEVLATELSLKSLQPAAALFLEGDGELVLLGVSEEDLSSRFPVQRGRMLLDC